MDQNTSTLPTHNYLQDLHPIEQPDLTERVHTILKEQILNQSLRSGAQIDIDEIAKTLGVSRTPVGTALLQLENEGLVVVKPRKGTFVKPLLTRDFLEAVDLREDLELFAARLAIQRASAEEIACLRSLAGEFGPFMDAQGKRSDIAGFSRKNAEFHDYHFQMAGNGKLLEVYRTLNIDLIQTRVYFRREARSAVEVQHEHFAIVRAYEERDLASLRAAISIHCQRGRHSMLSVIEEAGGSL